ncbi:hypothetical protein R3P38DRAFT_3341192 [Favolaschia claudopus]|uniref:Uncharacterized protein n=1 Tax=Favolaschia claudopus TaxID=2862362 RepID=A0AAW0E4W2_9AGAR
MGPGTDRITQERAPALRKLRQQGLRRKVWVSETTYEPLNLVESDLVRLHLTVHQIFLTHGLFQRDHRSNCRGYNYFELGIRSKWEGDEDCKKDGSCDETTQCSCTDGPNWYSNLVNSNEAPAPLLQIGSQTGIKAPSRSQLSGEGHIGYHKQLSERQMQGEGDGAEPPVGTRQPHMRMPARQILDLGRSDGRRG